MSYKIIWTQKAINNLEQIISYLSTCWSEKEVNNFKSSLTSLLSIISKFPEGFPISAKSPRLRKAVLSKHNSILYQIQDTEIYIVYLFDNRQNPGKLKLI